MHELYWMREAGFDLNRLDLSYDDWQILKEIAVYYKEREQEQMTDIFKLKK